ncbi:hypothetical protein FHG87_000534 [Trinorchestia longiramus]|nr:hypothetical protein FHG87_000534 [Trinorchestia longiramus]
MSAVGFEPGSFRSQVDSLTSRPSCMGAHHTMDFSLYVHHVIYGIKRKNVLDYTWVNIKLIKEELGSFEQDEVMKDEVAQEGFIILKEK